MDFSSDAIAEIEGLLEVNQDFCKRQLAEKTSPALPPNKSAITQGEGFAAVFLCLPLEGKVARL